MLFSSKDSKIFKSFDMTVIENCIFVSKLLKEVIVSRGYCTYCSYSVITSAIYVLNLKVAIRISFYQLRKSKLKEVLFTFFNKYGYQTFHIDIQGVKFSK